MKPPLVKTPYPDKPREEGMCRRTLVKLPTVGEVPLVLAAPLNKYVWKAKDSLGKEHKINTQWIMPSA